MQRRPPKTQKEKQFVAAYLSNGAHGTEAALATYNCTRSQNPRKTASVIASQNLLKLSIGDAFTQAGLTTQKLALEITRIALAATKRDPVTHALIPDNESRLKALKLATDLMNVRPDPKQDTLDECRSYVKQQGEAYGFKN